MQLVKDLDILSFRERLKMLVIVFNSLKNGSVERI